MNKSKKKVIEERPILDATSENLLREVEQYFAIDFTVWNRNHCQFQVVERDEKGKPKKGMISYYKDCQYAKIAHELLHAKYECLFDNEKFLCFQKGEVPITTALILNRNYWQEFGNQLQHYVMYPAYKQMGYNPLDFFESIAIPVDKIKQFINRGLKNGNTYNLVQVRIYLDVVLHMLCFPIDNRCKSFWKPLYRMNEELYNIHDTLFQSLKNIQLEPQCYDELHKVEAEFRVSLSKWLNENCPNYPTMNEWNFLEQYREI